MSKVVLLYPQNNSRLILVPPYPLMYLASAARKAGREPLLLDARVDRRADKRLEALLSAGDVDCLGVSVGMNYQLATALLASKVAKEYGVPVVWGGSFATFNAESFVRLPVVDAVFLGGAELSFQRYLEGGLPRTPGVVFKQNGRVHADHSRPAYDLNEYFPPAWDLVDPADYVRRYRDLHLMHVTTSRGCPHRCQFCYQPSMWRRKWSRLSVENVLAEVDLVRERCSVNAIYFFDDNFAVDKKRLLAIGEGLRARGVRWSSLVRANYLDGAFVRRLKELGCYKVCVGAESGSQRVLDSVNKDVRVADVLGAANVLGKHGLASEFFFMVGFLGETAADRAKTFALIDEVERRAGAETFLRVAIPFTGTPYHERAVAAGFQRPNDLVSLSEEKWDFRPPRLPWLTKRENAQIRRAVLSSMIRFVWQKSFKDLSLFKKFLYAVLAPLANLRWRVKFWGVPVDTGLYRTYVALKNRSKTKAAQRTAQRVKEALEAAKCARGQGTGEIAGEGTEKASRDAPRATGPPVATAAAVGGVGTSGVEPRD
ncbi:MAG: hypothetical protein Kow0069_05130 [Promethearchaeota archaeon]